MSFWDDYGEGLGGGDDDDDGGYLVYTRWFRVGWSHVLALGVGVDLQGPTFCLYFGPINIYLGDSADFE